MASSSKFDFPSSFSDGPSHPNGQRGPHAMASLERPGSFREANDGRISSPLPSTSRNGSLPSQVDGVHLLQTVVSDLKPVILIQRFPRPGEMRRSVSSILGIPMEDMLPSTISLNPISPSSAEDIKRLRNNLSEGCAKARDRSKAFEEATLKMDKFYNTARKRSRNDTSSMERAHPSLSVGNASKLSPHSYLTGSTMEFGPQKFEERVKSAGSNRRMRTSLVDVRASSSGRQSGPMDKDRDTFKLDNGDLTSTEEKSRGLQTVADGWEKSKMKKKRSTLKSDSSGSAVLVRSHESDRELKRGTQQKVVTDARPKLNNTHGFRSVLATGMAAVRKFDSASQPNAALSRPFGRNDPDSVSLSNDRDNIIGYDKESATLKASSKPNGREDNHAASPTSVMKTNTAVRGPRSNSGSASKAASPNMIRVVGNSDDWEHPQSLNKADGAARVANRKRSASVRSSSPPVAHWGGQRPQKITRVARRSNLPPVVSTRDEYPLLERHEGLAVNDDGLGFPRRLSTNSAKLKCDPILSESEESADKPSKDKRKKSSEVEDKRGLSVQNVAAPLPMRKSNIAALVDQEDSAQGHGKITRGVSPARSGLPIASEIFDNAGTTKQARSARIINEKIESKPLRAPSKKWSERKAQPRSRPSVNGGPLDIPGESNDDHEELLAAANAALNRGKCRTRTFWNDMENVFGFLSAEDTEFLEKEIRFTEDVPASSSVNRVGQCIKGDLHNNSLSTAQTISCQDGYGGASNGIVSFKMCVDGESPDQTKNITPLLDELLHENGGHNGVSVCQALLSAIIGDEEIENLNNKNHYQDEPLYANSYGFNFEVDTELKSKSFSFQRLGNFQGAEKPVLNSCKANGSWEHIGEPVFGNLQSNKNLDKLMSNFAVAANTSCSQYDYNQMSIDDRILLELSEIGLYPEPVPSLEQSEDEDISEGISRLTDKLHEQVTKKRRLLLKVEKAAKEARESQQRELESVALDELVVAAHKKYMACSGPNSSGSKNVSRTSKQQVSQAFVKRTLARCRQFEKTKTSCFSEPLFRNMFLSASSRDGDAKNKDLSSKEFAACRSTPSRHTDSSLTDQTRNQSAQADNHDYHLDPTSGSENPWSTKLKKKELLLDDVVGSALRAPSGLGNSLISSTKGKRSERDREGKGQNRDNLSRTRPAVSNVKLDKKNKSKAKQKTAQISASFSETKPNRNTKITKNDNSAPETNYQGNSDEAMDLCNLQLPGIDVTDFGVQGQDIDSWLNIEDDGLQDHDFMMGLQIPMDDLSDVLR